MLNKDRIAWIILSLVIVIIFAMSFFGFEIILGMGTSMCPGSKVALTLYKEVRNINELELNKTYAYRTIYHTDYYLFKVGDIGFTSHRMISRNNKSAIFKGDNNLYYENIPLKDIEAKKLIELPLWFCSKEDIKK